jgi:hypothetical protein
MQVKARALYPASGTPACGLCVLVCVGDNFFLHTHVARAIGYIGASNDHVAQAYAPIILSPSAVADTPYPSINNFYDDIREISSR